MAAVQSSFDCPHEMDVELQDIFSHTMYGDLRKMLHRHKAESDLKSLDHLWHSDFKHRKVISEFLKDESIGSKRLISMPERVTSCVETLDGNVLFRPSPVTGIEDDIGDIPSWWKLWLRYMFDIPVRIRGEYTSCTFSLLQPIPRSKYPELTSEEEAVNCPLQALCLALFDAALTWLLSVLAPDTWQPLRRALHRALHTDKPASCVAILRSCYADADVIFVQEASEAFAMSARSCLDHHLLWPKAADGRRRQTSLVLLRKGAFDASSTFDVTADVLDLLDQPCTEPGDLCAVSVASTAGGRLLLASFHGDSGGRSTAPVLAALDRLARERLPGHTVLIGLDANLPAGSDGSPTAAAAAAGLASCWDGRCGAWTTRKARTPLQPQLHKAVRRADALRPEHARLADWVLYRPGQLDSRSVAVDNTGRGCFDGGDGGGIPSSSFPSDHAIVLTTFCIIRRDAPTALLARPTSPPQTELPQRSDERPWAGKRARMAAHGSRCGDGLR